MDLRRASTVAACSLCIVGRAAALASPAEAPRPAALSTIDHTQVELTQDAVDRDIDASREIFRTPGLPSSRSSDPAARSRLDAIAVRHGFADYGAYGRVEDNIGFVLAGTDPDTKRYIGRDAVIAKFVADAEKDGSVPDAVKASRIAVIRSMKDDTPDLRYPGNIAIVGRTYDRILRSMRGED